MSGESIQKIFEGEREEDDEGWIDQFDNSKIYDEEKEQYNRDEPNDLKDKWEKIRLKLEDEWEGVDTEQVLQEGPLQRTWPHLPFVRVDFCDSC
jgi:hypothetical protein